MSSNISLKVYLGLTGTLSSQPPPSRILLLAYPKWYPQRKTLVPFVPEVPVLTRFFRNFRTSRWAWGWHGTKNGGYYYRDLAKNSLLWNKAMVLFDSVDPAYKKNLSISHITIVCTSSIPPASSISMFGSTPFVLPNHSRPKGVWVQKMYGNKKVLPLGQLIFS